MATMLHSPADIIRQVIIDLNLGMDPDVDDAVWPVYAGGEPGEPDEVITVYDTQAQSDGQTMIDGEIMEHPGIQVRIRAKNHRTGYAKAFAIRKALSENVYQMTVNLDTSAYLVLSVVKYGGIMTLGKEPSISKRNLFTFNALTVIEPLEGG